MHPVRRRIRVTHRECGSDTRVLCVERARLDVLHARSIRQRSVAAVPRNVRFMVLLLLLVMLLLLQRHSEAGRTKVGVSELRRAVHAALAAAGHVRRELGWTLEERSGAVRRHVEVRVLVHRPRVDRVGEHDAWAALFEGVRRREGSQGRGVDGRVEEVVERVVDEHVHHVALEPRGRRVGHRRRRRGVVVVVVQGPEARDVVKERDVGDGVPLVSVVERRVHRVDFCRCGRHARAFGA